jgi:hypothetical protein
MEAVRIVADLKLAEQTEALMVKLDAATTHLQRVGLVVGILSVSVMLGQVLVALAK